MRVLIPFILVGFLYVLAGDGVQFPADWPDMKFVEEGVILKGNPLYGIVPGYHMTLMNDKAWEHFKKHFKDFRMKKEVPPFPVGSKVVFVNFKGKHYKTPRIILVMLKTGKLGDVGGWKWEGFVMPEKRRIVKTPSKDCANCHYKGKKNWDGIFVPHAK